LDEGRDDRQLGVVGATDQCTYTGARCMHWAGGVSGGDGQSGYAIQGNILVGQRVILDMEQAWLDNPDLPFTFRLMKALVAGDHAGGDKRGRQSAALYAVAPAAGYDHSGVLADLRVDDHHEATSELARLLDLHDLYFGRPDPAALLPLTGDLAVAVRGHLAALGHQADDLDRALLGWAGIENLEERLSPGSIDPLLLQQLRAAAKGLG
jgi:uncharacterized Ntn-hydrolase superfamily protein